MIFFYHLFNFFREIIWLLFFNYLQQYRDFLHIYRGIEAEDKSSYFIEFKIKPVEVILHFFFFEKKFKYIWI